jgi:hypothetical protein
MLKNEEISLKEIQEDSRFQIQKINNQLKSKLNMIDLIKDLQSKIIEISEIWTNDYHYDFLNNDYPFEISIDELSLKFYQWIESSIKSLNDELTILSEN